MNKKKVKVFTICNYVTDDDYEQFSRNKTGYGYVVGNIICGLSSIVETAVFTYSGNYNSFSYMGAEIRSNRFFDVLSKTRPLDVWRAIRFLCKQIKHKKEALRVVYSYLALGYLKRESKDFDTIHVHGCTPNLIPFIKLAVESGKNTLVTLHGLNSFSTETKASLLTRNSERLLLKLVCVYPNLSISVLTPKAKEIIVNHADIDISGKIFVIPNLLKSDFNFPNGGKDNAGTKLVLYIGNLSEQKNQKALLNVIIKNWEYYKGKVKFLFIGEICGDFNFEVDFFKNKNDLVEFAGHIPRIELKKIYSRAHLIVLLSKVEGFGMSIIEGFAAGVPVLINKEMEIYSLIGQKEYVFSVSDIDDVLQVENKLKEALSAKVDSDTISEFSKEFNSQSIIHKYLSVMS
jgi:glycosyltransferase involved in cell wall biosynthesis